MESTRDPSADEAFLEIALSEICAGEEPSDATRVLDAPPERRAAAAAAVDAVAVEARSRAGQRIWLAAAIVVVGSAIAWAASRLATSERPAEAQHSGWVASSADAARTEPAPSSAATDAQLTDFLDRFHRVMPRQPIALRDPLVRRNVAPTAVPVLRQINAFLSEHREERRFRSVLREFTIYALALGDEVADARVRDLAKSDPIEAGLLRAVAELIAAPDAQARHAALTSFERLLAEPSDAAPSAVRCALIAADLTATEATALARAACDPQLAANLDKAAGWAAKDPRKLLGQPLVLEGKLANGERFSTASMRGRVVIVHFWASWSVRCDYALPDVLRARVKFLDKGVSVVGVSCDRDPATLKDYLEKHPEMSWPQLFDAEHPGWHALATSLGVNLIPRVFLIDRDGIVRSVDAQEDLLAEVARLVGD